MERERSGGYNIGLELALFGGAIGLCVITSPIWIPVLAYRSLKDAHYSVTNFKYRDDSNVVNYPLPDDLHDLEMIHSLHPVNWTRLNVGEVELNSGKKAVYSVVHVRDIPPRGNTFIDMEGYRLNARKVRRFSSEIQEEIASEIEEKLFSFGYPIRFGILCCE